ncbi:hypothetical protein FRC07_008894 [Ceratobasidium sp. 392]|nr:hypothetical protein FRC07_008894 [Ceratobasidium sp. 392]
MHPVGLHFKSKRWVEQQMSSDAVASDNQTIALECLNRLDSGPLRASDGHLSDTHLFDLLSNRWLCDEHLNACGQYINERSIDKSIGISSTFFIQNLRDYRTRHSGVWAPRKPHKLDKLVVSEEIRTILIPTHTPGHWSLIVIDIPSRSYSYTDSLDLNHQQAPGDIIPLLDWWFSSVLNVAYTLRAAPRSFQAASQFDSYSCGPFVMSTMAQLMLHTGIWSSEQAALHRMRWFLALTEPEKSFQETDVIDLCDSDNPVSSSASESGSDSDSDCGTEAEYTAPSEPQEILPRPPPRVLKQSKLPFATISREDWLLQEQRRKSQLQEANRFHDELEKETRETKKLRDRERARLKKRSQRARKRARTAQTLLENQSSPLSEELPAAGASQHSSNTFHPAEHLADGVAELSRPHRQSKKVLKSAKSSKNNCTPPSIEEQRSKRVNWMHPFLWSMIKAAVTDDKVLAAASHGNRPLGGVVRHSILSDYPEVVDTIKQKLTRFRALGIPLGITAIRALMIAVIRKDAPDLFKRYLRADKLFTCSYSFVRSFLHKELNWSFRRPTRAAQSTPANMGTVLRRAFLRLACLIRDENIPACCIVNADQTQVVYSHGCEYTWTHEGDKQVPVVGKDEKRAYTLLIGVANSGDALPFQAIYPGMTRASVPHESAAGYAEAQKLGMKFEPSLTKTYWATQATMRSYVTEILVPYFQSQIKAHGLPSDQRCVFQIDAWSVHRSAEFRSWMSTTYPWITLQYIPGGCTGYFQACDVALQRVVKAAIRQQALSDLVNETTEAIEGGADMETFKNRTILKTLRDRSVLWMIQGYNAINKPELVRKAFSLCAVPDSAFNLSYESLTSHEARKALLALKTSDPEFYRELMMGSPDEPVDGALEDQPSEVDEEVDCSADDIEGALMASSTRSDFDRALAESEPEYESEDDCAPLKTQTTTAKVASRLPGKELRPGKDLKRKRR